MYEVINMFGELKKWAIWINNNCVGTLYAQDKDNAKDLARINYAIGDKDTLEVEQVPNALRTK